MIVDANRIARKLWSPRNRGKAEKRQYQQKDWKYLNQIDLLVKNQQKHHYEWKNDHHQMVDR